MRRIGGMVWIVFCALVFLGVGRRDAWAVGQAREGAAARPRAARTTARRAARRAARPAARRAAPRRAARPAARPAAAAPAGARPAAAAPAAAEGQANQKPEGMPAGGDKKAPGADMGPGAGAGPGGAGPGGAGPGGAGTKGEGEGGEKAKKKKKRVGCFGGSWTSMIFLVLMFAVFYFLLIRPQQKKQKQLQAMLSELKVGDQVVTQGGMLGKITGFTDPFVVLEIQEKVRIKILRSSISGKHGDAGKQGK